MTNVIVPYRDRSVRVEEAGWRLPSKSVTHAHGLVPAPQPKLGWIGESFESRVPVECWRQRYTPNVTQPFRVTAAGAQKGWWTRKRWRWWRCRSLTQMLFPSPMIHPMMALYRCRCTDAAAPRCSRSTHSDLDSRDQQAILPDELGIRSRLSRVLVSFWKTVFWVDSRISDRYVLVFLTLFSLQYVQYKPQEAIITWPPFFQYNKRLLRQKTGGACLYMLQFSCPPSSPDLHPKRSPYRHTPLALQYKIQVAGFS